MTASKAAVSSLISAALLVAAAMAGPLAWSPRAWGAEAAASGPPGPGGLSEWNGAWTMDWEKGAWIMFDPTHAYMEPDTSGYADPGVHAGNYLNAIPYKPQYQKQYMDIVARAKAGESLDSVGIGCRPYGMPRFMGGQPSGFQILATPEVVAVIGDVDTRMIYTDGRNHPMGDDATSFWDGHAIGRWEGDTLVVDTVSIFAGNYDGSSAPHSDQIHVVERLRLTDSNTLEDQMTIEDPVMFTRPWTVTRKYRRGRIKWPNRELSNCGPRDTIEFSKGFQTMILPSDRAGKQDNARP